MTVRQHLADLSITLSRWIARIVGLLASGPFLLFLVFLGAAICPNLSWSNPQEMPLLISHLGTRRTQSLSAR